MILETLVTTVSPLGIPHIAPMGVHVDSDGFFIILPFKPSTTLDNLLATRQAVVNRCDDVRVFAGCLTGRRDWQLVPAERIQAPRLADCLSHLEVELAQVEDDERRPKLHCRAVHEASHKPFQGYNRAQFAVLEAAILVSRLHMLPLAKIESELHYLHTALEKTAGGKEREAWQWLMDAVNEFKRNQSAEEECP